MSDHYTAIIRVLHVEKDEVPTTPRPFGSSDKSDKKKENREVVSLTIRADSIEALISKATSHLALVEDING